METFQENLGKKKHWKRDQNEIALTEISVYKFLKTCCFAPFFQCLQTNKYICKKKIYIDHTQSQPICTRLLPYKSARQQITIFDRNQQH